MQSLTQQARIFLSPPHLGADESELVHEAMQGNWIAPVGPHLDLFEVELAEKIGADHACALTSGTASIHLGLLLLDVQPGDVVLCSSLTFVASANPIRLCGAEPVFVDADPDTWCMSVPALERALIALESSGRTPKACIAVSLYGQCADMPAITAACHAHGTKVMDEAAEALGASHGERMAGTMGDLGVYSFNGNKIITTSSGGAVVSNDGEMVERARFLSTQARDPSPIGGYEHSQSGFNYRLSNVLAGIGRGQLTVLSERIASKRHIFERYREQLSDINCISWMPEAEYGRSTRWLSCCLLDDASVRDPLLEKMRARNIDARPVWKPMHRQKLFEECSFFEHEPGTDVSTELFSRGICLPSGSSLSHEDQDRVIETIRTFLG